MNFIAVLRAKLTRKVLNFLRFCALCIIKLALRTVPGKVAAILEVLPSARLKFDVLVVLGSEALAIGRNQIALLAYRRALQLRPDDLGLREQLGVTEFLAALY